MKTELDQAIEALTKLRVRAVKKSDDKLEKDLYDIEQLIFKYQDSQFKDGRADGWIACSERPLITIEPPLGWVCTEDGDKEFLAAVPYSDVNKPGQQLWWIRHCVVEDGNGLCVVGDDFNEPAGWSIEDVTHWQPLPKGPQESAPSPTNNNLNT